MSDPTLTAPLSYVPARVPPPRKPFSLWEIVCWIVLVITVAVPIAFPDMARSRSSALAPTTAPSALPAPAIDFLLQSRYVVGVEELMHAANQHLPSDLAQSLEQAAKTDADRFRTQLVIRDLKGPAAVRTSLEEFAAQSGTLGADARLILQRDGVAPQTTDPVSTPDEFRAHHGWFGDLALSQGSPDSNPQRAAPLAAAERTLFAVVAGFGIAAVATFLGLLLLIFLIVWRVNGKLRPAPTSPDASPQRRPYLTGFTIYLALLSTISLILLRLGAPEWILLVLYFAGPILAILWLLLCGHSWRQIRATTGFNTGKGVWREIFAGIAGYIAGLPLLALGVAVTVILVKISGRDASHPIEGAISSDPLRLAIIFGLASVYAPLTEELMFRGFFYEHLRWRMGYVWSALITSLVFAAIHPQGWPAIPVLGAIGFTLATLREYRGSLLPGMAAHALNNTFVLALLAFAIS